MSVLQPVLYSVVLSVMMVMGVGMPRPAAAQPGGDSAYALVVHGGAGAIEKSNMSPKREQRYRAKLQEALQAGYTVLERGGSSLDAVETAIRVMEASPLFNAGKGAVFTSEKTVELDASIMDGRTRQAGAVTGVKHTKSPIRLARRVMDASPHVMMAGAGADAFARQHGLEMVPNDYFYTDRRLRQIERRQQQEQGGDGASARGTVGAVALDQAGNLAAGTSTGGTLNKRFGRVGDSPIIGAGTYANNESCAVSATGHGEYFIRGVIAHDIAAMMQYANRSLVDAARAVITGKLTERGGTGGVIAIDPEGHIAMPFNTAGMFRGYIDTDGRQVIKLYGPE